MKKKRPLLGFAILSHKQPEQLLRLTQKLSEMFDEPPISIHHDFSQHKLDKDKFNKNVQFVTPSIVTSWGEWSLVEAAMLAIKNLYKRQYSPEWTLFISGNDYPIQRADKVKEFYEDTSYDAFVSSKKLTKASLFTKREFYWFARYQWPIKDYPSFFHLLKSIKKARLIKKPIVLKEKWAQQFLTPFSSDYPCYGGSFWFSINRTAVEELIDTFEKNKKLCNYYKNKSLPEESFFVTVLNNGKNLNVHSFNHRYIDWAKNIGSHPKQLNMSDLPALMRAEEHFARKIDMDTDSDLLDELDKLIDS